MKKAAVLLLCVLCIVSMLSMTVAAADTMTFTVQTYQANATIKAGETFDITVSIGAVQKLACLECKLRYDKTKITPIASKKQGFLSECLMADVNIAPVTPHTKDPDVGEIWLTGLADGDKTITAAQTIATITFRANVDLSQSTAIEIFRTPIAATSAMDEISCQIVNGGIKVTNSASRPTITTATATPTEPTTTAPTETVPSTAVTGDTTAVASTTTPTIPSDAQDEEGSMENPEIVRIPRADSPLGKLTADLSLHNAIVCVALIAVGGLLLFVGIAVIIIGAIVNRKRRKRLNTTDTVKKC